MAAHLVPVADVCREPLAQLIEIPPVELVIVFPPVIPEGPLQLAVGLRVPDRGVREPDPEVRAEGGEEPTLDRNVRMIQSRCRFIWADSSVSAAP
jgi:hypothetical protein